MTTTIATEPAVRRLSRAELRRRWLAMIANPLLADVPGKLELNEKGSIELTPPNNKHALYQARIAGELQRLLPEGTAFTECSVETDIGVRVPDVAWASADFMRRHGTTTPFPSAPEICVEVLSPSNTDVEIRDKVAAYLAAGAREVWIVAEEGAVEIVNDGGAQPASAFGVALTLPA
jgi:Uma2 family endonuclease